MGKCYKCGKETDRLFWTNRDFARRFGEEDKYWCQECRDKADAFREWENEQSFTKEIVCHGAVKNNQTLGNSVTGTMNMNA